ncbi:fungal-specific transcription factor domain-containing protein [Dendryphion nanum]|uniref:Fungal-specific transcription factor domain-containing protein n=1 Tax=Dendryphion nanum TaxID=256645 RepID=A0A9P9DKS8_9PLEO|nr:fungal-specific transcription factor domain-containing protein [Dendryphion nanum]
MADSSASSKAASQSPNANSSAKSHMAGGRQRIISSCLTCRRRKVKCDHVHPICGACNRGSHICTYATDQQVTSQTGSGRVGKSSFPSNGKVPRGVDVQARLDRLELLLEKAVSGQATATPRGSNHSNINFERQREPESQISPSSNSQSSHGAGMSSDNHNGTLLLDEGQSQFVSSLHYALLADEIQDIKALLGDKSEDERETPTGINLVHLLSLGRAKIGSTLQAFLPQSQEHQDALLEIYFLNVDPMVRITHKPTLLRRFSLYIEETHPIPFAVFYAAVNSLPPHICEEKFGESKDELLGRFELGVEISLARENYLTTSSLEVLQGFVLWLTCITKEDNMGKAWALLGIAIRIALNQGLHRDPSLFPVGSMDTVTIELRRRMWHQVSHLEYRAAECKGQEPSIRDEDFTTMMPRNIEDEDLIEGASPGPTAYDEERCTSITFQLVRFAGMRTLRRIVQNTYRLERRMLESNLQGAAGPDPVCELQQIYEQIKVMVDDLHEENQRKFLRYCNPEVPLQRLSLGLASLLEWRCYLLFWLRMPRAYRDIVFSGDIRKSIFEKSVNCVETLNGASVDVDATRFHWHIGGHAAFQAIMHILSELRNPLFECPDRQRALRALKMSRLLKEDNTTKAWAVVKNMIDKVLGEQFDPHRSQSESSPVSYITPQSVPNSKPMGANFSSYVDRIPAYAYQHPVSPSSRQISLTSQPMQTMQTMQPVNSIQTMPPELNPQFTWDDINLNMIAGDTPLQNPEMPEFDWGFWGDTVNFNDPAAVSYPMDTDITYVPF